MAKKLEKSLVKNLKKIEKEIIKTTMK